MAHIRPLSGAVGIVVLLGLAFTSGALAQSSSAGKCAGCTAVGPAGTCSGSLPVCVDTSSGGDNNLPCGELIPGAEAAYGAQMSAKMSQDIMNSMPDWMRTNQPAQRATAAAAPVPSDADVAAKQCSGDNPSKMCCSVKAFSGSSGVNSQAGASASSSTNSNLNSNSNSNVNVAGATTKSQNGAAGIAETSASVVAAATAGAFVLLQIV